MARLTAREVGRIESTYTSDLGKLTWTWIMKPDGKVLYRLSHINGHPERNDWRLVYQLSPTEQWQIESDASRAADFLARLALERGHRLERGR